MATLWTRAAIRNALGTAQLAGQKLFENLLAEQQNNYRTVEGVITLGSAGQRYLRVPYKGQLIAVYTVIQGALSTADETLTIKDDGGNSIGTITLAYSGSAAGDKDSLTSNLSNTDFEQGHNIEIETDGNNGNSVECNVVALFSLDDSGNVTES